MKLIENENVVFIDVDETLVHHVPSSEWCPQQQTTPMKLNYYNMSFFVFPIKENIELLRAYKARGYTVFVWTNNGYRWGKEVINALDLNNYVDFVMTKPAKVVDDSAIQSWVQTINLDPNRKQ
jgi:hydroxymethylpyrimidine pyrophosphatase-like HAD family hydrolase